MSSRPVLVLSLLATAVGAFAVGVTAAQPALAAAPRTAVCAHSLAKEKGDPDSAAAIERWMNTQLAAGKSSFVVVPDSNNIGNPCAW